MEVKGTVIAVVPVVTGEGKNGMWKKQEYVIEYDRNAQYPRKMMFNLWGDKIDQNNIQLGQNLIVSFDIECREYNGKWFNDVRAWKIEPDNNPSVQSPAASSSAANTSVGTAFTPADPSPAITSADGTSDLPF
jgi:hypothetical protein